jgi:predicted nucleic acid-binding protein
LPNILQLSEDIEFFMPKYAIVELFKYKDKIVKYSKIPETRVLDAFYKLLKPIHFFDDDLITSENLRRAYELCQDIDEKDTVFLALVLELEALFWTGDKKLKQGLTPKGFQSFFEPLET